VADALSRRLHGAEELSWISTGTPHCYCSFNPVMPVIQWPKTYLLSCNYRVLLFPILHSETA
jgi:hypothetical protein